MNLRAVCKIKTPQDDDHAGKAARINLESSPHGTWGPLWTRL